MSILLNIAYTGKMIYLKSEEQDVFHAMTYLFFAEFANLSLEPVVENTTTTKESMSRDEGGEGNKENEWNIGEDEDATSIISSTNGSSSTRRQSLVFVKKDRVDCGVCTKQFGSETKLLIHLEESHKEEWLRLIASPEELECLTFCNFCGRQLKSIQVASKCLARHDMVSNN